MDDTQLPQYKKIDDTDLTFFRSVTGEEYVITSRDGLENVESIKKAVQAALVLIQDSETSAVDMLNESQVQLKSVAKVHTGIAELAKRIENVVLELKDIAAEFEDVQDSASLDPERLDEVSQRLSTLYRLQKKYTATNTAELIAIQTDIETKIRSFDNSAETIAALQKYIQQSAKDLGEQSDKLHQNRLRVVSGFQKGVEKSLQLVGMPNATFVADIQKTKNDQLNANGYSEVKFLFSANKGFAPQEIKNVASGGELSRLMLSIKSQVAIADHLPTMIFDEIDSGISGVFMWFAEFSFKNKPSQAQTGNITLLK